MTKTATVKNNFLTTKLSSSRRRVAVPVRNDGSFFVGKNPNGSWAYELFKKFNGKKRTN